MDSLKKTSSRECSGKNANLFDVYRLYRGQSCLYTTEGIEQVPLLKPARSGEINR